MKANIVQIGNSKGIRIPKALLEQLKFEKTVELEILPEGLLMRPISTKSNSRDGWAKQFAAALAETGAYDSTDFADWNENSLTTFDEAEW